MHEKRICIYLMCISIIVLGIDVSERQTAEMQRRPGTENRKGKASCFVSNARNELKDSNIQLGWRDRDIYYPPHFKLRIDFIIKTLGFEDHCLSQRKYFSE